MFYADSSFASSLSRAQPPSSRRELMLRALALRGRTVAEVASALSIALPQSSIRGKGFVGQLLEAALGADLQAGVGPDFSGLEIELKTLPVSAALRPLESTFVCSIDMLVADRETFAQSRLRARLAWVLWVPIIAPRGTAVGDRVIGRARLWRPTPYVWRQLKRDWDLLMGTIGAGGTQRLTAHRGHILQVRPKGPSREARVLGLGPEGVQRVAPLGFYLRPSFTARALLIGA